MFRIEVAREDGNCILEYRDGEDTIFNIEDKRNKITGSTVSFIPDPEIFENTK
jgi:DNA gyrase/topoisomerase IV subunit B